MLFLDNYWVYFSVANLRTEAITNLSAHTQTESEREREDQIKFIPTILFMIASAPLFYPFLLSLLGFLLSILFLSVIFSDTFSPPFYSVIPVCVPVMSTFYFLIPASMRPISWLQCVCNRMIDKTLVSCLEKKSRRLQITLIYTQTKIHTHIFCSSKPIHHYMNKMIY